MVWLLGLLSLWQCLISLPHQKKNKKNKKTTTTTRTGETSSAVRRSVLHRWWSSLSPSWSCWRRPSPSPQRSGLQKIRNVQGSNQCRAHFPPVDIHPIRTTLMGHKLQETFHLILTQKDLLKFLCHGTKNLSEKINPQPTCQKRLSRSQKLTYGGAGNISLSQKISWRKWWVLLLMTNQQKWRMSTARKIKMRKTQPSMKVRQEATKNWTTLLCLWSRLQAFCSTFVKL